MLVRSEVGDPACSQTKETDIDSACKLSRGAQTYDDCWHTRFLEGYSRHHSAGIPQIPCSHLRGRAAPSSVIYNPLGWEKPGVAGQRLLAIFSENESLSPCLSQNPADLISNCTTSVAAGVTEH